ncbi:hypothetical protein [Aeromicrobium sp.]|uniref:hypothetical protein n=1 Tax=Aeromicrobium sp. TaxID=1871063 RepID=UPI0030C0B00C
MAAELWILAATAVLAVVAIGAAVIAVRAARRNPARSVGTATKPPSNGLAVLDPTPLRPEPHATPRELEPHVAEGRLIVPPSEQQVVSAALSRPGVRLSILAHGVAHALRAESRDRIVSLMRREYRQRRRERLQAGRRAVRAGRPTPPSDRWLGS